MSNNNFELDLGNNVQPQQTVSTAVEQNPVISELVKHIGTNLANFYLEYCKENDLFHPEEFKEHNIDVSVLQDNDLYNKSYKAIVILEILQKGDNNEEFATLIQATYLNFKNNGFSHYDSLSNVLDIFDLTFDSEMFPKLRVKDEDEIAELEFEKKEENEE